MDRVHLLIEKYIENRIVHEPSWRNLTVYYSGHLVPGEGEHKIMQHIRVRKQSPTYQPNQRHCLVGQDADLIMLGLATHEPHFTLLRDVVNFGKPKRAEEGAAADVGTIPQAFFLTEQPLQLLHLSVLREYLEVEFTYGLRGIKLDRERLVDDFIFLTFLVGNDFLPHLPSLDITESAFDLIFSVYKNLLTSSPSSPRYIVENGAIKDLDMLQKLFQMIGRDEEKLMKRRDMLLRSKLKPIREVEAVEPVSLTALPAEGDEMSLLKPETDGTLRENDAQLGEQLLLGLRDDPDAVSSVTSSSALVIDDDLPPPVGEDGHVDPIVIKSIESSTMLIDTGRVGPVYPGITPTGQKVYGALNENIQNFSYRDHHYRYKFGVVPSEPSAEPLLKDLSYQYLRGLVWCLSYYTSGCVSWEWYYPYHYAPMLTDVTDVASVIPTIRFSLGAPFTPFQQLLGCLPPSSSSLLPRPYQWLMIDPLSPLKHVYPTEFVEDMDGKRHSWEAITILPFIDSKEVLAAEKIHVPVSALSAAEQKRNILQDKNSLFRSDNGELVSYPCHYQIRPSNPFKAELVQGTCIPYFGFPSLRSLPISGVDAKVLPTSPNRFYRYKSLVLHIADSLQVDFPLHKLISRTAYIHYPLCQEALVIGVGTIASELRHVDYLSLETKHGPQATRDSFPLEEDPKIIQRVRTEQEVETWALASMRLRNIHLCGGIGLSGLELGRIKTRLVVVPVINRIKDKLTGDIHRIYGTAPVDIPLQLVRWTHPAVNHKKPIQEVASAQKKWTQQRSFSTAATAPLSLSQRGGGLLRRGLLLALKRWK
jgi:hypothetical protein